MKWKYFPVLLCGIFLLSGCFATQPVLVTEGGKTFVQWGSARFAVPPGFEVLDHVDNVAAGDMTESMVIMAQAGEELYTVIVFSRQKAKRNHEFLKVDLTKIYPEAFFYDDDLEFLYNAATYIAQMPMSRELYLERPMSKVLTGYKYTGNRTRYRFDVYQNFKDEDPYQLCCGRTDTKQDKADHLKSMQGQKAEVEAFRAYALDMIQNNINW